MIIMTTSEGGVRVATQIDTLREYTSIDERGRSDITQCPSCGVFAVPRGITSTMKDDLGSFEVKHCPNCGHTYGRDTVAQSKSGTVIIEAYDVAAEVVDDDTPIAGALRVKFRLSAPFDFDDPDADIRLSYFTEENGELKPILNLLAGYAPLVKNKEWAGYLANIGSEGNPGKTYSKGTENNPEYLNQIPADVLIGSLVRSGLKSDGSMDYVEIDDFREAPGTYVIRIDVLNRAGIARTAYASVTVE